jgi:hypothetical protein
MGFLWNTLTGAYGAESRTEKASEFVLQREPLRDLSVSLPHSPSALILQLHAVVSTACDEHSAIHPQLHV